MFHVLHCELELMMITLVRMVFFVFLLANELHVCSY